MPRARPRRPRHRRLILAAVALALGLALTSVGPLRATPLTDPAAGPPVVGQADGCAPPRRAPPAAAPRPPAPPDPAPSAPDPANPLADAARQLVGGILVDLLAPVPTIIRQHLTSQFNILTQTCRQHTVELRQVREFWQISRTVAMSALTLIVIWAGYRVLARPLGFGADHAGALLARVAVAALAAGASGEWLGLFVDLNNTLIAALPPADVTALLTQFDGLAPVNRLVPGGFDLFRLALLTVLAVALLLYAVVAVVRLATLNLLIALCPIFMVLWVHRGTTAWAAWWWRLFLGALVCQPVQLLVIHLGALMAAEAGAPDAPLLAPLASIATVLTALSVPMLLGAPFAGSSVSRAATGALATAVTVRRVVGR